MSSQTAGLVLVAWLLAPGAGAAAPSGESIERSMLRTMQAFDVPGMAVSVVHEGKVVYAGGHGVVERGSSVLVDPSDPCRGSPWR